VQDPVGSALDNMDVAGEFSGNAVLLANAAAAVDLVAAQARDHLANSREVQVCLRLHLLSLPDQTYYSALAGWSRR
jgi:hypothetical protein